MRNYKKICSFCGATEDEEILVAGPNGVCICESCIGRSKEILKELKIERIRELGNKGIRKLGNLEKEKLKN